MDICEALIKFLLIEKMHLNINLVMSMIDSLLDPGTQHCIAEIVIALFITHYKTLIMFAISAFLRAERRLSVSQSQEYVQFIKIRMTE